MNGAPWTPTEDTVLRECVAARMPVHQIATKLVGRTVSAIRNRIDVLGVRRSATLPTPAEPPTPEALWREAADAAARDVQIKQDAYEWLRPIQMDAPARRPVTSTPAPFTLVAGDFHFGMQDDRACAVFLQSVEALKPRQVILNGDTVDLLAVSTWPKDQRRGKTWSLQDEARAFQGFLRTLHDIGDSWGLQITETSANHSGNGTDGRWWRYLNARCPELLQLDHAEERLSYQSWFFPQWSNIVLQDSVMLADEALLVLHGDIVRSEGGYTAKASREKWMHSVLVNHVHRIGVSAKTITAIHGKPTSYVIGYENGCMCKLEVPYGRALNWQQSFAIVCEAPGLFGIEQVVLNHGRANVATLGRTLTA